jgi:hypothetical protein
MVSNEGAAWVDPGVLVGKALATVRGADERSALGADVFTRDLAVPGGMSLGWIVGLGLSD